MIHSAAVLSFVDVSLRRGSRALLTGVSFTLHAGEKLGVVGDNGSGKSTLLAAVTGELAPDTGNVQMPSGSIVAHVAQERVADERPAIEHVLDGDTELRALEAALDRARGDGDGVREAALHADLEAADAYRARSRAARLLVGLGFAPEDGDRPLSAFSGGYRVRLDLARALMRRSDLLLLDEPTNHLDLDAVLWLEEWLRDYRGTLVVISHDREFLDPVVGRIAHLRDGKVFLYTGNYSAFERQRAEEITLSHRLAERQQREAARIRAFVDRFRYKASKARQAQSRLKALARMEQVVPAHVDSPLSFAFPEPRRLPNPLLALDRADAGYDPAHPVITRARLAIAPGDRIGLLGANGAGKSTLMRVLAGELAPLAGARETPAHLAIGYFAQHQVEQLDLQATGLVHLLREAPELREQEARDYLGGFGFPLERAQQAVATLSGGEKARLTLALILRRGPNLLLLDEPTNHLDLEMRRALGVALQGYEGGLVLVSHDRHLLRLVADTLWVVADGRVGPWDGDLDDYAEWLRARRRPSEDPGAGREPERDARARRRERAEQRQALAPLRAEVKRLERELQTLGARGAEIESRLADPAIYDATRRDDLTALLREQGDLRNLLDTVETRWLEASEALERESAAD